MQGLFYKNVKLFVNNFKKMIIHFVLGFITSYLGFTPPSMLNLTVGKIFIEQDKKSAYQFILGASIVVFFQVFLSFVIVSSINKFPNILFWIKNSAIILFTFVSFYFLKKGINTGVDKIEKRYKNSFIHGLSLSIINMFAIPFFAVIYSLLVVEGYINSKTINLLTYAIGIFFGTIAILGSYIYIIKKIKNKIITLTKFINPIIGVITGFFAVYTAIKLYV